jgi:tripartite-type tricarboxylate transporter receptor subunit TctC
MRPAAPPDGHTLLPASVTHVINPGLVKNLPYDTLRDFAPVTMFMDSPLVFVGRLSARIGQVRR